MGVSAVGILSALICNLAFLKALLGFLIGAIFFSLSIVCQAIFINRAILSVEDAGLEHSELSEYRRRVIDLAEKSICLTVGFIGFTFPLILADDAYMGLSVHSLFILGAIGAAVFLLIYVVVLYFLNASLLNKGVYNLNEKESEIYRRNHKLKGRCAVILVLLFAVTFALHQTAAMIWDPWSIMDGIIFDDYESFIAYMEQNIPAKLGQSPNFNGSSFEEEIGSPIYYDEQGNEISKEEALTRRLEDKNGNAVCEYTALNESVISVGYTPKDGTILPITVYTENDLVKAKQTAAVRHVIFGGVYCVELLAAMSLYFKKRAK